MKPTKHNSLVPIAAPLGAIIALLGLSLAGHASAQAFNSGSDGSYGPMNITSNTILILPTNGIFHCTTITVAGGATLTFARNPLNTPVYLLATGDVVIAGTIDVSGRSSAQALAGEGGPGGFDGGFPGAASAEQPGDGYGPGGGRGGDPSLFSPDRAWAGSFGTVGQVSSQVLYGNPLLMPLIGGSGGGGQKGNPGFGGGGGGGAILIASSTVIEQGGQISANGGRAPNNVGEGSGGGIRLVAPRVFGNGRFDAISSTGLGGNGIIRIDAIDRSGWNFSFNGKTRQGQNMVVFPPPYRLSIIEAAGQMIAEGGSGTVSVQLPHGASTNQLVKVQARNFTNDVAIRVVVTPEMGPSSRYDTNIVLNGNPSSVTVPVVLPAGQVSRINAWTR